MPIEIYFAPKAGAQTINLQDLSKLFSIDGNRCSIKKETEELFWLVFNKYESSILFSVSGTAIVFATLHWVSSKDEVCIVEHITRVFEGLNWFNSK
ncbi:MAG TPA: hypothetical protein VEQ18_05080 [Candidatus Nitrosocosmicus sp.]|nr:hypothetical protein [Candidatus Nitrosocosmicus sp.]